MLEAMRNNTYEGDYDRKDRAVQKCFAALPTASVT